MGNPTMVNNVVPKDTIRSIQQNVLDELSEILKQSFGPMGSNTVIKKEKALNVYTKDGHTILSNIAFHGIIEQSIKDDIETITRHIVTTVGDGTTSGVMMAARIYRAINEISDRFEIPPVEILRHFKYIVNNICDKIKKESKECTIDDIYDICMISTNGNDFISNTIADIYRNFGNEVFIDVAAAIDENTIIKSFDGMTIDTGFCDPCFITDTRKNEAVVDNPRIYFFKDPIDTKEMAVMFDAILSKNIVEPFNIVAKGGQATITPTVIIAPKISRDLSSLMTKIITLMGQLPPSEKLPLLIISDYHQEEEVEDICKLCLGKSIHKYIDPNIMEEDIKNGDAPTPETIRDFCGYCEEVISGSFKTSFINPIAMKDDDGSYTTTYTNLINYLENELKRAQEIGEDIRLIGTLKRRIHSLKSNLVEISVGGISPTDRDATRDLVEDAVKNCRSAAANGVGYGANYMGLKASLDVLTEYVSAGETESISLNEEESSDISKACSEIKEGIEKSINELISSKDEEITSNDIDAAISSAIFKAYCDIADELYSTVVSEPYKVTLDSIDKGCPYNIRTNEFDFKVKSSIESDIIVLQTVNKIIGLMATSNQFIVPSPMHNVYVDYTEQ